MTLRQLPIQQPFELDKVLDGSQDFRWRPWKDGWHSGVLREDLIHIREIDGGVEYHANSDLDDLLRSYFRLDENLQAIYDDISSRDDKIAKLVKKYPHLRVLRQPDPWECTVSYICSANANIQKISKSVEAISEKLGDPLELDDDERHTFPRSETVLKAGPKPLKKLKLGLKHHKKIPAAAKRIRDGKLDLSCLAQQGVTYGEAKLQLMACPGIGPKVADCIALFALDKMQAFPVDTRIRNAVQCYFPSLELHDKHDQAIVHWAQDRFGEYAGYANQLLFQSQKNPR